MSAEERNRKLWEISDKHAENYFNRAYDDEQTNAKKRPLMDYIKDAIDEALETPPPITPNQQPEVSAEANEHAKLCAEVISSHLAFYLNSGTYPKEKFFVTDLPAKIQVAINNSIDRTTDNLREELATLRSEHETRLVAFEAYKLCRDKERDQLRAENDVLTQANKNLREENESWCKIDTNLRAELDILRNYNRNSEALDKLRAENEALRKDRERFFKCAEALLKYSAYPEHESNDVCANYDSALDEAHILLALHRAAMAKGAAKG